MATDFTFDDVKEFPGANPPPAVGLPQFVPGTMPTLNPVATNPVPVVPSAPAPSPTPLSRFWDGIMPPPSTTPTGGRNWQWNENTNPGGSGNPTPGANPMMPDFGPTLAGQRPGTAGGGFSMPDFGGSVLPVSPEIQMAKARAMQGKPVGIDAWRAISQDYIDKGEQNPWSGSGVGTPEQQKQWDEKDKATEAQADVAREYYENNPDAMKAMGIDHPHDLSVKDWAALGAHMNQTIAESARQKAQASNQQAQAGRQQQTQQFQDQERQYKEAFASGQVTSREDWEAQQKALADANKSEAADKNLANAGKIVPAANGGSLINNGRGGYIYVKPQTTPDNLKAATTLASAIKTAEAAPDGPQKDDFQRIANEAAAQVGVAKPYPNVGTPSGIPSTAPGNQNAPQGKPGGANKTQADPSTWFKNNS